MSNLRPNKELAELLKAISDGALSPEQHARLETILRDDAEARATYLRYVNTDAMLSWCYAPVPDMPSTAEDEDRALDTALQTALQVEGIVAGQVSSSPLDRDRLSSQPVWRRSLSLAAMLVVGLLVGATVGWTLHRSTPMQPVIAEANDEPILKQVDGESVATLVSVSKDIAWDEDHSMPREAGQALGKGWMRFNAGWVEMRFASGATVRVEGPAAFGVDSPMRGFLDYGRVSVHAPEEARDFMIGTGAMDVVDPGTRFTMTVDEHSGDAQVEVTEGLVDLHVGGQGTEHRIQPLLAGQSALVDATGEVIRIEGETIDPKFAASSSLVGHWTLDDLAADPQVADVSGRSLHGTLSGETDARSIPGKVGRAFDLSDRSSIDLSKHIPALTSTSTFTFAAWVCDADDMVFSMSDGTRYDRIQFELQGNRLLYGWQKGPQFDQIRARVPEWKRGEWYHIAVSVSGGAVTIYRDGRALNSPRSIGTSISTPTRVPIDIENPSHAFIGQLTANHANQRQFLGGKIDDVQFYSSALDERAIRFLYEHPGETYRADSSNSLPGGNQNDQ